MTDEMKDFIEKINEKSLTNFVKSTIILENEFQRYRKKGVKGAEFKREHFNELGQLNEEGLNYTRDLIENYQAIQNMFFSYLGWEASKGIKHY